jgi:hypothetical protein
MVTSKMLFVFSECSLTAPESNPIFGAGYFSYHLYMSINKKQNVYKYIKTKDPLRGLWLQIAKGHSPVDIIAKEYSHSLNIV